jgi:glycosyltransferase involved in cell wall biosynthesis
MHLFLNGMAASAGGGLTYLRNAVPELSKRSGVRVTVALSRDLHHEFEGLPNISCLAMKDTSGTLVRFWREQTSLGHLIKKSGADVLISAGNFALKHSPVPQILLSGNSLYTSRHFYADLRSRGDYRLLLDTFGKGCVAKRSLVWADCTVAPSEAFADELRHWTGIKVKTIYHGFDHDRFFRDRRPLPDEIQRKVDGARNAIRLLFVSHYNYYRNFETLFRAIPIIQQRLGGREVKLFLTCKLVSENNPGAYRAESAAALVRELNIGGNVVELGAVPYELLHGLYRSCQIYTTAAYTETFAHPLVEAMASGQPVVASDLGVHQEVCRDAARYFDRFSPEDLAAQIVQIAESQDLSQSLAAKGLIRARDFSWRSHVDQLLELAENL